MKRLIFVLIPVIVIAVLLALIILASSDGDKDDTTDSTSPVDSTAGDQPPPQDSQAAAPTQVAQSEDEQTASGGESAASEGTGPRVLAWQATSNGGGRLLQLQDGAMPQELFVTQAGRIQPCSHAYRLADGVILFVGNERGDLVYYPLDGSAPVTLGQTHRLTCAGPDTLQPFSDDQIAYVRYAADALNRPYRVGTLVIADLEGNESGGLDNTAAFTVTGGEVLALRFYPDGEGRASEADLDRWAADGTIQNLLTLVPQGEEDAVCQFMSGAVARWQDTIYLLTGETCAPGGARWRLKRIEGSAITEIASGEPGGSFYPDNFTAQVIPSTDGSAVLVAVPSGLQRHIARLLWVYPDGSTAEVAEFVQVDRLGERDLEGRHLLRSPDGRWLAVGKLTRDNVPSLWLVDLDNPGQTPQELVTLGTNERLYDYQWGPGGRLYFIAGNDTLNTLYVAVPGTQPERIARGRFTSLAPDSRGERVVVTEWVDDPDAPNHARSQTVLIDLTGKTTVLWQAGQPDVAAWVLGLE
jgi:hypothetical protein